MSLHREGSQPGRSRFAGFTLMEVMVALGIFAVALAIAVPSVNSYIGTARASSLAADMLVATRVARSEAVVRGAKVTLCAASAANGSTCATASPNWANGWILVQSDGTTVIKQWGAMTNMTATGSWNGVAKIDFTGATGAASSSSNPTFPVALNLCPSGLTGTTGATINLSANGRSTTNVYSGC